MNQVFSFCFTQICDLFPNMEYGCLCKRHNWKNVELKEKISFVQRKNVEIEKKNVKTEPNDIK